jgi:hypothetical protein
VDPELHVWSLLSPRITASGPDAAPIIRPSAHVGDLGLGLTPNERTY